MKRFLFLLLVFIPLISCEVEAQFSSFAVSTNNKLQSYSPEANAVFALMATAPTTAEKIIWNDFINRQVQNGNWSALRVFQLRATEASNNMLIDWKGNFNGTNHSATHSPGVGVTFDGAATYIDTGFTPSSGGGTLYTQNDGGMGVMVMDVIQPAQVGYAFGCSDSGNRRVGILQNAGTSIQHLINNSTAVSYTTDTRLYKGMYTTTRTASGAQRLSANGNALTTASNTSVGLPTLGVYEGCRNLTGTGAANFLNFTSAAFFVFKGTTFNQVDFTYDLIVMLMRLNQLHTAGLPSWATPLIHIVGQSNAVGTTSDTPSNSTLTNPITGVYIRALSFDVLDYPTNNQGNNFGIELTMGLALQAQYSRDIYMYKEAHQGAPVHQITTGGVFDFNVNSTGEYYDEWQTSSDGNLSAIRTLLDKIPISIMVLIQGEADCAALEDAQAWVSNWQADITALKGAGVGFSFFIYNRVNSGLSFGCSSTNVDALRDGATNWANIDNSRRAILEMNTWGALNSSSYPHYVGSQYEQGGYTVANIIINQFIR